MAAIITSATPMSGGVAPVTGVSKKFRLQVTGTWATDEHFTLTFSDALSGRTVVVGYGPVTGATPSYLKTFKRKLYSIAETTLFFSALDAPTTINAPNQPGNSYIEMSNEYGFAEPLLGLAIYQGKMAVLERRSIQIWSLDADPVLNTQSQSLENIGTVSGKSVRGIGDQDVLFCADSGVRSLRVRDASNNAVVTDLGTPVDSLIQAALESEPDQDNLRIASIVEPRSNRYWLAIGGTIFVFSYFQSSGVAAWNTYTPTYPDATVQSYVIGPTGVATFSGLTVGSTYSWTPGSDGSYHFSTLQCGADRLTSAGTFIATATTATAAGVFGPPIGTVALTCTNAAFLADKMVVRKGIIYIRSKIGRAHV